MPVWRSHRPGRKHHVCLCSDPFRYTSRILSVRNAWQPVFLCDKPIFFIVHSIVVCIVVALRVQGIQHVWIPIFVHNIVCRKMEDIVDLGETCEYPSTQVPAWAHIDFPEEFFDGDDPGPITPTAGQRGGRGGGRSRVGQSAQISSQSQAALPHKVRGPNWTGPEMLVLIGQKRIEWDERHISNQPSLAKFMYGTTTWRAVLAGCMSVVGFRARDTDQITNK